MFGYANVCLNDVGEFIRGKRFVRKDITSEGVPCIHYGDLYTTYGTSTTYTKTFLSKEKAQNLRFANPRDVIIVGAGENNTDIGIGVAWLGKEKVAVHDACYIYKSDINPLYLSYYLRTKKYHDQIKKYVSEGKICSISAIGIGKAIIPLVSNEKQREIVAKLQKFERYTADIVDGLPAEIESRQKQYEYYRDKLLTFKPLKEN